MHRTSFTVQVWTGQMDIIKKAAKKQNVSIMEYVRRRLMPLAAEDAGVELPEFPAFYKGRHSAQTQAAAAMGIPLEEWRKQVLRTVAEAAVKQLGSGAPPPQTIKRTRAGH